MAVPRNIQDLTLVNYKAHLEEYFSIIHLCYQYDLGYCCFLIYNVCVCVRRCAELEKELAMQKEKIHHLDDMLKSQQRKVRHMIEQVFLHTSLLSSHTKCTNMLPHNANDLSGAQKHTGSH